MTTVEIINMVLAGGLLGVLGQGIRIAVGLKKLNDNNTIKKMQNEETEPFSTSRLLISIFIGFIAGAVALFIKGPDAAGYSKNAIVTIIAAGYSGADFIEGFFKTYLSKASTLASGTATPVLQTGPQAATPTPAPANTVRLQPLVVPDEAAPNTSQALG